MTKVLTLLDDVPKVNSQGATALGLPNRFAARPLKDRIGLLFCLSLPQRGFGQALEIREYLTGVTTFNRKVGVPDFILISRLPGPKHVTMWLRAGTRGSRK